MRQLSLVPWTALHDLGAVAALLGRDRGELTVQLSMLPDGIEGVALARGEGPARWGCSSAPTWPRPDGARSPG